MTRFLTCGLVAACVLGFALRQAQGQAPQAPIFRGGSDVVRVFVTVTDHDGKLVANLTRDAFELRDEGKPQPITQFDNSPQPIRLIVMLDVSGSMEGNLPLLRGAAAQLFARLGKDDVARVGAFGNDVVLSPAFTHDARELTAALPTTIAPDAPTPLWRALTQAIDAFGSEDDRRKVILVLSDGKDSGITSFNLREHPASQAEVIDHARAQDVMVYAVGMRSRSSQPMSPGAGPGGLRAALLADMPDPGLARVAEETGGGYTEIRFGQDLAAAFAGVADELHAQYLLGFATPKRDGKVHDIDVRVSKSGLKTRARKSYVAPK
ncbi:MAG TPA: VWA domain-containing protein [Vicinamibacterales bacterium]|nr:VWA domain-containing protein [Vicinamibacterales bacterium]